MEVNTSTYPTLSALYLSSLIDIIDGFGWEREKQLAALGFSVVELADPRMRVGVDTCCKHFNQASKILDRPEIGVQMGHKFRISTYGNTGSIYNFCDSLSDGVRISRRYQPLVETAGRPDFIEENGRAYMQWNPNFEGDEHYRIITDVIFGGYAATVQWLSWGFDKGVKSVEFRHAKPEYAEVYETLFQCPVSFSQTNNRLEFFPETVYRPMPTSDAIKKESICNTLDKLMLSFEGETVISRKVRGAIRRLMGQKQVTLINVASELGVSERTLRRQLSAEGVNFRSMVDLVRKDMFDTLSGRGESLTSIAYLLGYSDQSAFTRAFRRWYGMSPSAYRSKSRPL